MNAIAYCQPFVPPEWIAAHGLRPLWLRPDGATGQAGRGRCHVAEAVVETVEQGLSAAALVLTTACDQMRCAAAVLEQNGRTPVFLMHVPRTWQTSAVREYYGEELQRLGRFLAECGGTPPAEGELLRVMTEYDDARANLLRCRAEMSAVGFVEAVAAVRGELDLSQNAYQGGCPRITCGTAALGCAESPKTAEGGCPANSKVILGHLRGSLATGGSIALALIGGPLLPSDGKVLKSLEKAGGRIALDATEMGERTLPAAVDRERAKIDPFDELVRMYFDSIPDVFRRPNDRLYEWLRPRLKERGVRGLIVRRHVWCDLWHAELPRLRQETGLPVLDWDADGSDRGASASALGRIEAFLEMLR